MRSDITKNPSEVMSEHFNNLKEYVHRVIIGGETLTPVEEADKDLRMDEYLGIGTSFKCTPAELTASLYDGLFDKKGRGCDCSSCVTRRSDEQTVH